MARSLPTCRAAVTGTLALCLLLALPAAPAAHAAHAAHALRTPADLARLRAPVVLKPAKRARTTAMPLARGPIRLAALTDAGRLQATALSEEEARAALEQDLSLKIGKHTQPFDYPAQAMLERLSGTAMVAAVIAGDGVVKRVALSRSSGFRVLDEQALVLVRRVSKVYVPAGLRARERTVTVPVGFYLQQM